MYKHGVQVRLQEQPFRVLLALLEKPGEVVTREELQQKAWPGNAFGDFEHSLNIAINKIREALRDSAENPRFVETIPRRGYRFTAPVEVPLAPFPAPPETPKAPVTRVKPPWPKWVPVTGAVLAIIALFAGIAVWLAPSSPPTLEFRRLTNDSTPKVGPVLSDGARLYYKNGLIGGSLGRIADLQVRQVPVSGGEPSSTPFVPAPGRYLTLLDITSDGRELLLVTFDGDFQPEAAPLWTLRTADGSSHRIGNLMAKQARYSKDGRHLAFTVGGVFSPGSLWIASGDGSNERRLLERKGLVVVNPCWSPDGKRIVFGQLNRTTQEASAWEVMADGTRLQRLFPDWRESHVPAGWTPEGSLILISQSRLWTVEPPSFFQSGASRRVQLSSGEPQFSDLLQVGGSQTYAVGNTPLGELQRYDTRSGTWVQHLGGISAEGVEYSRDGESLVYVTYPEGELWVRRSDTSQPVRLTAAPMRAALARWSPDGKIIAFIGQSTPGQPHRIYLVDSAGGSVRPACPKDCGPQGDFSWGPDGKKILFALPASRFTTGRDHLQLLDLGTGEVTRFPGSDGLFSPRWSPDGSAVVALQSPFMRGQEIGKNRSLMLYRFSKGTWMGLLNDPMSPGWPGWSHDGKSIWYINYARGAIIRCNVLENRHEVMMTLNREEMTGSFGTWFNITPGGEPMILRRRDINQVYALEWKRR